MVCRDGYWGAFLPGARNCFLASSSLRVLGDGQAVRGGGGGLAGGGGGHVLGPQIVDVAERHHEEEEGGADQPGIDVPFVGQASADAEPDLVGGTGGPIETSRILCCHGRRSVMSDVLVSRRVCSLNKSVSNSE